MRVERVSVRVPATVANLGPGFDILAIALELENEVLVERVATAGISLEVDPATPAELTDVRENLVVRAYTATCAELGALADGVHLRCTNRIPMRRGLGSSSAAVVAGVLAATTLHAAPWDEEAILAFAAGIEGHPDNVAAALLGGLVIVPPDASPARMDVSPHLRVVLFVPDLELPTPLARRVVANAFTRADAVFNAARCALWIRAVSLGEWGLLRTATEDRWHQLPRSALYPQLPDLLGAAYAGGARGAAMAGAGPSIVAFVDDDPAPVQAALLACAERLGLRGTCLVSRVRNHGAAVQLLPS